MKLWNIIRDFYVKYIFGGLASDYTANNADFFIGNGTDSNGQRQPFRGNLEVPIFGGNTLTISDWLSTTATIITLAVFVVILFLMLRWLFKVVSGLILLRY